MPVGTMTPARPRGAGEIGEQFGEQRISVDVAAAGQREAAAILLRHAGEHRDASAMRFAASNSS